MSDEMQDRRDSERRIDPGPYDGPERRHRPRRAVDRRDLVLQAINRFMAFRKFSDAADLIDEASGLTACDVDLLMEQLTIEPTLSTETAVEPTAAALDRVQLRLRWAQIAASGAVPTPKISDMALRH